MRTREILRPSRLRSNSQPSEESNTFVPVRRAGVSSAQVIAPGNSSASRRPYSLFALGAIAAPRDTSLAAFGDDLMGIRFRTKVVAANADKTILGMSKSFRAENDEGGAADCILPLMRLPKENENVWEIVYTDDGPNLAINASLEKQVVQMNYFLALVFPAVIREILTYAFIENDADELGEWTEDWKLFARALGAEEFPQLAGGDDRDDDKDAIRKWIDSAVQAFVRGKGLAEIANQWKDDAE